MSNKLFKSISKKMNFDFPHSLNEMNILNTQQYIDAVNRMNKIAADPDLNAHMKERLCLLQTAVKQSWQNFSGLYITHLGDVNAWIADRNTNPVEARWFIEYMTQDFHYTHPDWIIENFHCSILDPLSDLYTHKWDEDDVLVSFYFALHKHYLFTGVDIPQFHAGEIFWDSAEDDFSVKTIYQYLRDLDGVIPEMYDEKMRKLPPSEMPEEYRKYDTIVQITPENAKEYVGQLIMFTSRGHTTYKNILGVSFSGKSIHIDHPDLNNCLQLVTRKVYLA